MYGFRSNIKRFVWTLFIVVISSGMSDAADIVFSSDSSSILVQDSSRRVVYQWQNSTDSVSWHDISGATHASYVLPTVSPKRTLYRVRANSSRSGEVYSAPVAADKTTFTLEVNREHGTTDAPYLVLDGATLPGALTPSVSQEQFPDTAYNYKWTCGGTDKDTSWSLTAFKVTFGSNEEMQTYTFTVTSKSDASQTYSADFVLKKAEAITNVSISANSDIQSGDTVCNGTSAEVSVASVSGGSGNSQKLLTYKYIWQRRDHYNATTGQWDAWRNTITDAFGNSSNPYPIQNITDSFQIRCLVCDMHNNHTGVIPTPVTEDYYDAVSNTITIHIRPTLLGAKCRLSEHWTKKDSTWSKVNDYTSSNDVCEVLACKSDSLRFVIDSVYFDRDSMDFATAQARGFTFTWPAGFKEDGSFLCTNVPDDGDGFEGSVKVTASDAFCGTEVRSNKIYVSLYTSLDSLTIKSNLEKEKLYCRGEDLSTDSAVFKIDSTHQYPEGGALSYQWLSLTGATDTPVVPKGKATEVSWELVKDATIDSLSRGKGCFADTTMWYCLRIIRTSGSCTDTVYSNPLAVRVDTAMQVKVSIDGSGSSGAEHSVSFKNGAVQGQVQTEAKPLVVNCEGEYTVSIAVSPATKNYEVKRYKLKDSTNDYDATTNPYLPWEYGSVGSTGTITDGSGTLKDSTRVGFAGTQSYELHIKSTTCPKDSLVLRFAVQQPKEFKIKELQVGCKDSALSVTKDLSLKVGEWPHFKVSLTDSTADLGKGYTHYSDSICSSEDMVSTWGCTIADYDYTWQYTDVSPYEADGTTLKTDPNLWRDTSVTQSRKLPQDRSECTFNKKYAEITSVDTVIDVTKTREMGYNAVADGDKRCTYSYRDTVTYATPCERWWRVVVKNSCDPNPRTVISDVVHVTVESDFIAPRIGGKDTLVCKYINYETLHCLNGDSLVRHISSCDKMYYRWERYDTTGGGGKSWKPATMMTLVTNFDKGAFDYTPLDTVKDTIWYRLHTCLTRSDTGVANFAWDKEVYSDTLKILVPADVKVSGILVNGTSGQIAGDGSHADILPGVTMELPITFEKPVTGGRPFEGGIYKYEWRYGFSQGDQPFPHIFTSENSIGQGTSALYPKLSVADFGSSSIIYVRCYVYDLCLDSPYVSNRNQPSSNDVDLSLRQGLVPCRIAIQGNSLSHSTDTLLCVNGTLGRPLYVANLDSVQDSLYPGERLAFHWEYTTSLTDPVRWDTVFPLDTFGKDASSVELDIRSETIPQTRYYRLCTKSTMSPAVILYSDTVTLHTSDPLVVPTQAFDERRYFGCVNSKILMPVTYSGGKDVTVRWCYKATAPTVDDGWVETSDSDSVLVREAPYFYRARVTTVCGESILSSSFCTICPWSELSSPIGACVAAPAAVCMGGTYAVSFDTAHVSGSTPEKDYVLQYRKGSTDPWRDTLRWSNDTTHKSLFVDGKVHFSMSSADTTRLWRVAVFDTCGNYVASDSVLATVHPLPESRSLGDTIVTEVCKNQQEVYHIVSPQDGITYKWELYPDASVGVVEQPADDSTRATITWTGLNTTTNMLISMRNGTTTCVDTLPLVPVHICNDSVPLVDKILRKPGGQVLVATIADTVDKIGYYIWGRGDSTLQRGSKRYLIMSDTVIHVSDDYWLTIKRDSSAFCKSTIHYDGSEDESTAHAAQQWLDQFHVLVAPQTPAEGDDVDVDVDNAGGSEVTARLFEPRGMKLLRSATVRGENQVHLSLPMTVPKGVYFLEVQVGASRKTIKLLVR